MTRRPPLLGGFQFGSDGDPLIKDVLVAGRGSTPSECLLSLSGSPRSFLPFQGPNSLSILSSKITGVTAGFPTRVWALNVSLLLLVCGVSDSMSWL